MMTSRSNEVVESMIVSGLTGSEMVMAATIGVMRNVSAKKHNLTNRHGLKDEESNWQYHIEGACGELALAKHLNLHWSGSVNTFKKGGDVFFYQVRTRSSHLYELILRPGDDPNVIYWLLTGTAPTYFVRGWILGRYGMRDEWKKDYGGRSPAWFVPHSALSVERESTKPQ